MTNNNNPFRFEPSADLARALGVTEYPLTPHPPKSQPPASLYNDKNEDEVHSAREAVPFFLLDQPLHTNNDFDSTSVTTDTTASTTISSEVQDSSSDDKTTSSDDDNYASWTVSELKAALKERNLPVSGKKADLVQRLQQASSLSSSTTSSSLSEESSSSDSHNNMYLHLSPPPIQRGVDRASIQGAVVAATAVTALASKSIVWSSVVGLGAAYAAITQSSVGDVTRQVGAVVWEGVLAAVSAIKMNDDGDDNNSLWSASLHWMGSFVNKTIASVESGIAAASLVRELEEQQQQQQLAVTASFAGISEPSSTQQSNEQTIFRQRMMEVRFQYDAATRERLLAKAQEAAKQKQTEFQQELMAARFRAELRARAARQEELELEGIRRVAEEMKRQEQLRFLEEKAAASRAEQQRQTEFQQELMAFRFQLDQRARAALLEELAREEEERRVADENERLERTKMIEERTRMEEEARAIAAEEALRLANEAVPDMIEEFSTEEWEESIRIAQQSIEGKIAGLAEEYSVAPDQKASWAKAEQLAKELSVGGDLVGEDIDDLDDLDFESLDFSAVGNAARAAVEEFEKMREVFVPESDESAWQRGRSEPVTKADLTKDWMAFTVAQLRIECKARGLSTFGKKVDLVARIEAVDKASPPLRNDEEDESDDDVELLGAVDDLDDIDFDNLDFSAVGTAARTAVEEFEKMRETAIIEDPIPELPETARSQLTIVELRLACESLGLSASGKKAELVARLKTAEDNAYAGADLDSSTAVPWSSQDTPASIDWNTLTVKELKQELQDRGLPTTGKKADCVAALEAWSKSNSEVMTNGLETDLAELAAQFGETDEEDDDLDFDSLDLEALGEAARQAVTTFNLADAVDEEPTDEDLWEILETMEISDVDDDTEDAPTDNFATRAVSYEKLTIAELKDELRSRGLSLTGKKSNLIARLQEASMLEQLERKPR
jgi:hypothetical protein